MAIKDVLINLRKEKGLTQKQIAKVLGMSETGYASWEQGLAEPSLDAIRKLCKIFDVSANEILELDS